MWLGDDKHPLCSRECAERCADDRFDAELDGEDGIWRQCSGYIDDGYDPEPGNVCIMCKKPITEESKP